MVELAKQVPSAEELIGQRIELKGKFCSIRYFGKLRNNPKAGDDLWLGVEWDEEGTGKHNGTVDGEEYFTPQLHKTSPSFPDTKSCSFLRFGKVPIGGQSFSDAIMHKYKPENMKTEEERELQRKKEEADLYVNTQGGKGIKKIEILGAEKAFNWRSDVQHARDISLENSRISCLGPSGMINQCIPGTMNLYLDRNLLYSWDQYFEMIKELPFLRIIVLTGNKFRRLPKDYFEDKNIAELTHTHLYELVFIDMGLDWEQIDTLTPVLSYCEHLHLVNNYCSKISSLYKIPKDHFKLLKFINLENNGIESWEEVIEFRHLPSLQKLTLNKNKIRQVEYKPGFKELKYLSLEDNLINQWDSFNAINEYSSVKDLRILRNPILEESVGGARARDIGIARCQFLNRFNGTWLDEAERKDCEIYYMKLTFKEFLQTLSESDKITELEDQRLGAFVNKDHPRFYQLCELYGSPVGTVKAQEQKTNLDANSAKVQLISDVEGTRGKTLNKKLLLSMTVAQLKAMCSKLFKVEVIRQKLMYMEEGFEGTFDFDVEQRSLSFYSIKDGGKIIVQEVA